MAVCGFCLNDLAGQASYPAGPDQIVPLFFKAMQFESQYPARWDFDTQLGNKMHEYQIPGVRRLYCRNYVNASNLPEPAYPFQGRMDGFSHTTALHPDEVQDAEQHDIPMATCDAFLTKRRVGRRSHFRCLFCQGHTCLRCGTPKGPTLSPLPKPDCCAHAVQQESIEAGLEHLTKGRDYQLCPGCGVIGYLGEACNQISCPTCRTSYCYICAALVRHNDSSHWRPGMPCPRFNQPGAANAMYDGDVVGGGVVGPAEGFAGEQGAAAAPAPAPNLAGVDLAEGNDWAFELQQDKLPDDVLHVLITLHLRYQAIPIEPALADDPAVQRQHIAAIALAIWQALLMLHRPGIRAPFDGRNRVQIVDGIRRVVGTMIRVHDAIDAAMHREGGFHAVVEGAAIMPAMELLIPLFEAWRNAAEAAQVAIDAADAADAAAPVVQGG
ncbi:hypothetical protein LTR53_003743 [Teratosphaeriaceae sp. CCFEE 6253]|nr:hypothetical protein LTR53_003743 [Teratosphaeriaceae sp. CCFEE 6253]